MRDANAGPSQRSHGRRRLYIGAILVIASLAAIAIGWNVANAHPMRDQIHLFLLIPTVPAAGGLALCGIVCGAHALANLRLDRGLARLTDGHCPMCGYDVRASHDRCPECGWPTLRPDSPLRWPSPEPLRPWLMSRRTALRLYGAWCLSQRDQTAVTEWNPQSSRATAEKLVEVCCRPARCSKVVFMPDDSWRVVSLDHPASLKPNIELALSIRLTHVEFASLRNLSLGEVVERLQRAEPHRP